MATKNNPILNNPYEEPGRHYATDVDGNLDYTKIVKGRRLFVPDTPVIPVGQGPQDSLFDLNDIAADYKNHIVNSTRREIGIWRRDGYPNVTSRVTRLLLDYWFSDPKREDYQKLFFAQREAVETAIWLNEVAEKSNAGTHILNQLRDTQQTAGENPADQLPRIAFKMATGTGKTVVMACLILYHYLNRQAYPRDPRYADAFLVIAPGITIRDRLGVLRTDPGHKTAKDAYDYYRQRWLVPPSEEATVEGLNARIVITNYHSFQPRTLSGNKRSPFDGKKDAEGNKQEALEDPVQVLERIFGRKRLGRRLLVLNDEAHHCYRPRAKGVTTDETDSVTENSRAAVWFTGLRELAGRYELRAVYDLSATPYYLQGSGYPAYSLFPWVVSDFGLVEAIESGLVKIPFLPVEDTSQELDEAVLLNLYEHVKQDLPQRGQRKRRKDQTDTLTAPPQLPPLVKQALNQFYNHYDEYDRGKRKRGEQDLDLLSEPPVFILVCGNTSVSREVYKEIAGYEHKAPDGESIVVPGKYAHFSNYDPVTNQPRPRPPTLLIDSDALEQGDQINTDFKKVFATEIDQFRREYRRRHPDRNADALDEGDLLREVINTVGKPSSLGSHVRCVVSVSMLTEGWDANTVTHIYGLRAFGSQLLCEQVAGRALRRRSYFLDPKTKTFPPEYAHIIGVPFKVFRGGETPPPPPPDQAKRIHALPERADMEIHFPNVVGYRVEQDFARLTADFSARPDFQIDFTKRPLESVLGNAFSPEKERLKVQDVLEKRDQEILYWLTQNLISVYYRDDEGHPLFHLFGQLKEIVSVWYRTKIKLFGTSNTDYRRAIIFDDPHAIAQHLQAGIIDAHIKTGTGPRILPVLNHYNPFGSTRHVWGQTRKVVYETKRSHVNRVVMDSGWEGKTAKELDGMKKVVESYVKNQFLGFAIPYEKDGRQREYYPDFIARLRLKQGRRVNLIIEITGMNKDKAEKRWTVEQRWLPAVNAARDQIDGGEWDFLEVAEDIRPLRNLLDEKIAALNSQGN